MTTPGEHIALLPVDRATLAQLDDDVSGDDLVALWAAVENPRELIDGEEVGES